MKEANGEAIQTLASYTVSEAQIENLVTAKGYTDCVAFIGDESVSVVVSAREGGLTDADVAKITGGQPGEDYRGRGIGGSGARGEKPVVISLFCGTMKTTE